LLATCTLFAGVCASVAYWEQQLNKPLPAPLVARSRAAPAAPSMDAVMGLFGGQPASVAATFRLQGVIAAGPDSVAFLVEDGKPARAVRVGTEAVPGVTLTAVQTRFVLLDRGGAVVRVDLPDGATGGLQALVPAPDAQSAAAGPASAPAHVSRGPDEAPRSGGPMPPPIVNPALEKTPGQMPVQPPQMRRPSGIGPAAFGAKPTS